MFRPSTWLRSRFKYGGDQAKWISCRYGRVLSPCSWKPLGCIVKTIPYGMLRSLCFALPGPSRVSTLSERMNALRGLG